MLLSLLKTPPKRLFLPHPILLRSFAMEHSQLLHPLLGQLPSYLISLFGPMHVKVVDMAHHQLPIPIQQVNLGWADATPNPDALVGLCLPPEECVVQIVELDALLCCFSSEQSDYLVDGGECHAELQAGGEGIALFGIGPAGLAKQLAQDVHN